MKGHPGKRVAHPTLQNQNPSPQRDEAATKSKSISRE
jgi:hypothetical protein